MGESCVSNLVAGKKSEHPMLVQHSFINHTTGHHRDAFIPTTRKRPLLGDVGWEFQCDESLFLLL